MRQYRLRLTDNDIALLASALKARAAMTGGMRRHRLERLIERLTQLQPGNPRWRIDDYRQTHEEELSGADKPEA